MIEYIHIIPHQLSAANLALFDWSRAYKILALISRSVPELRNRELLFFFAAVSRTLGKAEHFMIKMTELEL